MDVLKLCIARFACSSRNQWRGVHGMTNPAKPGTDEATRPAVDAEVTRKAVKKTLRSGGQDRDAETGTKRRYHLELPADLYEQLRQVAANKEVTVAVLLRQFIKLGLVVSQLEHKPDAALLIREGKTLREIILF
jgi:hypothetical protein